MSNLPIETNRSILKNEAGLWIDHREAIIVTLHSGSEKTKRIESHVEKQLRRSSSDALTGADTVPADDTRERGFTGHLAHYFDEVIAGIGNAESIVIFGPGEAKGELKKRMEKEHKGRQIALKSANKMTEPQIVAAVRHYFNHESARIGT